ncbi:nitroreductase family protein [Streptomyces beigongshangae]|uniref:nitroreductase family protein n=1 Tax=Streptomyces beigongshangae TaxID=2841597 RepID=UPI0027E1E8F2|nr:nitroreductase family protein [Streptomyces sp. REN17]
MIAETESDSDDGRTATTDSWQRDALLEARYGQQATPENIIWNEQIEALLAHRSVRAFTDEPLPNGALETVVAAARSASTSSSLHQWSPVSQVRPYGEVNLDTDTRLGLTAATVPGPRAADGKGVRSTVEKAWTCAGAAR